MIGDSIKLTPFWEDIKNSVGEENFYIFKDGIDVNVGAEKSVLKFKAKNHKGYEVDLAIVIENEILSNLIKSDLGKVIKKEMDAFKVKEKIDE